MRVARNEEESRQAFRLCTDEAKSSFGDDRMLIEKFVENPRHIEVQVLCDRHGNGIWLNERECSIQRRNQKVIEEAPSTFVDPELRKAMGEQAVALAKAVGYDSAGTVEFLVDSKKNFYFLEMNTRLQVEHPITECITGIDIVHQMLRSAKGHKLLYRQSDIPVQGWALECRVYAEDPLKNFGMPSIGRLSKYIEPNHIHNVRCDSGVQEGSEISIYYDPMICKLVTHGPDRQSAIDTMVTALDSYIIKGVSHNIPLLRDIMTEPRFVKGDINTSYLPDVFPGGFKGKQMKQEEMEHLVALACVIHGMEDQRSYEFLNQKRLEVISNKEKCWSMNVEHAGKTYQAVVIKAADAYEVKIGGNVYMVTGDMLFTSPLMDFRVNGERRLVQFVDKGHGYNYKLRLFGTVWSLRVLSDCAAELNQYMPEFKEVDTSNVILAPMPGVLKSIAVKAGEQVAEGQEVCVLEAMKMQNSLLTQKVQKVKKVFFKPGSTVNEGDVIVEFEK